MRARLVCLLITVSACDSKSDAQPEPARSAAPSATAERQTEPPPGDCKASGKEPMKLGKAQGHVYGFAVDPTHVYYSSWQLYGGRGDLGSARKDGGGARNLASLSLEPRGLVADGTNVYYTAGIRLMSLPKDGGEQKVLAPTFSSQSIAGDATHIYGVPGDYGPYDRLIRVEKKSGTTKELDVSERPESKHAPFGFSAIAVDASGVYVTDSSADRVLRFGLDREKPKVLATKQEKAYDIAIDAENVYFTLAQKGLLMKVPKAGGTPAKVGSGLAVRARIAADDSAIVTTVAGATDDAPQSLALIPLDGGAPALLTTVPRGQSIEAVALDGKCIYWAQRNSDNHEVGIFARAR